MLLTILVTIGGLSWGFIKTFTKQEIIQGKGISKKIHVKV